jgi:HSP20 family molecular chaperone IbpA
MSAPRLMFSSRPVPHSTVPKFLAGSEADAMEQRISQKISERARLLFEQSGSAPGNDNANWLRAESEILSNGLELRESGTWVICNALIAATSGQDMQIIVKPNRIVVRAVERTDNAEISSQSNVQEKPEIFLAANLMVEVDPASAAASFRDSYLHLMVKKASAK